MLEEEVEGEGDRNGHNEHEKSLISESDLKKRDGSRERGLDNPWLCAPGQERSVHKDHGDSESTDHHGFKRLLEKRTNTCPLRQNPDNQGSEDRQGNAPVVRETDLAGEEKDDECPQHVEFAVSKIDHLKNPEDQCETDGHQGINAADQETVCQVLKKHKPIRPR